MVVSQAVSLLVLLVTTVFTSVLLFTSGSSIIGGAGATPSTSRHKLLALLSPVVWVMTALSSVSIRPTPNGTSANTNTYFYEGGTDTLSFATDGTSNCRPELQHPLRCLHISDHQCCWFNRHQCCGQWHYDHRFIDGLTAATGAITLGTYTSTVYDLTKLG